MTASQWVKYAVKVVVAHALYAVGLLHVWQSIVMRRKAVILMYHRVLTAEERRRTGTHPAIVVDRDTFAKHMAVLKRRFRVLSLEEFADQIEGKIPFRASSCLITFDDGWRDNFTNALPILRSYGLPAVIFLPVNYIGRERLFWQETLAHVLVRATITTRREPARQARLRELLTLTGLQEIVDLPDVDPRSAIIAAISAKKGLTPSMIDTTLATLKKELGGEDIGGDETDGFVNWEQVEIMSRQGIQFGGHGTEHRLLSRVSIDEAREEIRVAKEVIDARLKEATVAFSYPRGYWTAEVAEAVKACGYRLAFVARGGLVSREDDRFTLRRVNIHESVTNSTPMFLARVVGLF